MRIGKDGCVKLPFGIRKTQKLLCIHAGSDYKLVPLLPDVRRVYIEVTTKCNFRCVTCIRSSWQDELADMSWETFEHILNSLRQLPQLQSVHFGGFGEPMMHPKIFEMLKAVKELGLKAEMITNGSFLHEEIIRAIIDSKLDVLFTSLDSPDADEYNEIRRGADFQSVYHNVVNLQEVKRKLKVQKPELGIEFVAMKKNFSKLPKLIRLAWEINASRVIITNLMPYHEDMKDEIVYDIDDTDCLFGRDSLLTAVRAQMANMKLRTERCCKFVQDKSLCINHLGNVSPCYALMHSYQCYVYGRQKQIYPYFLGNVKERSLLEIWLESEYVKFRNSVLEYHFPSCTDCKSLDGCNYAYSNETDCWANSPSCADCLWSRQIILCP